MFVSILYMLIRNGGNKDTHTYIYIYIERERETIMTKIIIAQYLSIGHIAKMKEILVSYQIINFIKNTVLFQWINMIILKVTEHKLVPIILYMAGLRMLMLMPQRVLVCLICLNVLMDHTFFKILEMYGIIITENQWFSNFLRGCKHAVKFHQETT